MNPKTPNGSLKRKILGSMIVAPALPFFALVAIGFYFFSQSIETQTLAKVSRIVEDHRTMIDAFLQERRSDIQFIMDSYSYDDLTDPGRLKKIFNSLQNKSAAFTDIGVFDQDGLHVAYYGPYELQGINYSDTDWFRELQDQAVHINDVFLGYRNVPHFVIAVIKRTPERAWIIRASIDSSMFSNVVEKIRIGNTGDAYLVNHNFKLQTSRHSGGNLMQPVEQPGIESGLFRGVRTFVATESTGESYLYAAAWLNNKDWLLVARQEKGEALQSLTTLTYLVILVAMLGGFLIIALAFSITNRLFRQLEQVSSEKKELGRQLVVAGRLAEIGEMSAGFAHEINNPLQIIKSELTLIETILDDLKAKAVLAQDEDVDQVEDSLKQIRTQVDRCGNITQALLKFARRKEAKVTRVDLKRFLPDIMALVAKKAQVEGVSLTLDIAPGTPIIDADGSQLEQVVLNLLNNALYAVLEKHGSSGGAIRIQAASEPDGRVVVSVTDNGNGIHPDNVEKIFTPFFTTKPVGKGTGLGLSICYGIVTEMGGAMEVTSDPGAGATFSIHLKQAQSAEKD